MHPEPAAPRTPPGTGPEDARTAHHAPPAAAAGAVSPWVRWAHKPYLLLPAIVAVALAVGLGMGVGLGDGGTASASTAQVATVTRGSMTESVSAEGTVAAA